MKKILTLILILFSFIVYSQEEGENINVDLMKLNNAIYGNKSGGIDTVIVVNADSTGQFKYKNMSDPAVDLDGINLRTLVAYIATDGGWDSVVFNSSDGYLRAYLSGSVVDSTSIDDRYLLLSAAGDTVRANLPDIIVSDGTILDKSISIFKGTSGDTIESSNMLIDGIGNILPTIADSFELGSATKPFKDAHFRDVNGVPFTARQLSRLHRDYSEEAAILPYTISESTSGGVWTITLTEVESNGFLAFVLDDKTLFSIGSTMSVNATAVAGTDASPNTVYVYVQNDGSDNPELVATNTSPEGVVIHAHVSNYKVGSVSTSSTKIYGKSDAVIEMYKLASNIYHRTFYQGPIYFSGLTQVVTSTDLTIGVGSYESIFETITTTQKQVTVDSLFFVKNDGTYSTLNDFSFDVEYSDGVAIADGKFFNVVLGVMENGNTNIMALVQSGGSEEYKDFNKAFEDKKNQTIYRPTDAFLKNLFVSVCRIIVKRDGVNYVLQQFDDGNYFYDLRNESGSGGGSSSAANIADGTVDDQLTTWNNTTGEWEPISRSAILLTGFDSTGFEVSQSQVVGLTDSLDLKLDKDAVGDSITNNPTVIANSGLTLDDVTTNGDVTSNGIDVGSVSISGANINTGGTLGNVAYLDNANAFTATGTTSFLGRISPLSIVTGNQIVSTASGLNVANVFNATANNGAGNQWGTLQSIMNTESGQSTVNELDGILTLLNHYSGFTLPTWRGVETGGAFVDGVGSIVNYAYGLDANLPTVTNSGSVGVAAAIHIASQSTSGITSPYAILSQQTAPSLFSGNLYLTNNTGNNSSFGTTNDYTSITASTNGFQLKTNRDTTVIYTDSLGVTTIGNTETHGLSLTPSLIINGMGLDNGSSESGNYGGLLLNANRNYSGSARKYLITNAYAINKFAIIRSADASTYPALGVGGAISSGTVDFVIDNTGKIGLGTIAPTAKVHIAAGTATASTAPFKFTSGTNLTTAEAGAFEYDGAKLYFTPSGTTRETVAYVSDITAATHTHVFNETPSGTINGSNTTFTCTQTFTANSSQVYLNGQRQVLGLMYTESTNTIVFEAAYIPITDDILRIDFIY